MRETPSSFVFWLGGRSERVRPRSTTCLCEARCVADDPVARRRPVGRCLGGAAARGRLISSMAGRRGFCVSALVDGAKEARSARNPAAGVSGGDAFSRSGPRLAAPADGAAPAPSLARHRRSGTGTIPAGTIPAGTVLVLAAAVRLRGLRSEIFGREVGARECVRGLRPVCAKPGVLPTTR
jgi:hypothetical protein